MPDYSKGKIYCIRSPHTDEVYIGSTTQSLAKRLGAHKKEYIIWKNGKRRYITSFKLIELNDVYIELVEEYPCQNKEQLNRREGEVMRHTENAVNKYIPGRTVKQFYAENPEKYEKLKQSAIEYSQKYRIENSDFVKERKKKYYDINKDKIFQYNKTYNEMNKDLIRKKRKLYREANKEKIQKSKRDYREKNLEKLREKDRLRYKKKKEQKIITDIII